MLYIDEKLMQPIMLLAIVGVATMAMGVGFLNTNTFTLIAQDLASQEVTLVSPVDTVRVDFEIVKEAQFTGTDMNGNPHTVFVNKIDKCSFHSDDNLYPTSQIICKLTDMQGDIIAEGNIVLDRTYTNSLKTYIPITMEAFTNAADVQNVNDVKIIILGVNPVQQAVNP
jgi:hypothetical protein